MEVLPALPILALRTSISGSLDSNELTVYSGQTFDYAVVLKNVSAKDDRYSIVPEVELELTQPTVTGGPSLVELVTNEEGATPSGSGSQGKTTVLRGVQAMESRTVKFR